MGLWIYMKDENTLLPRGVLSIAGRLDVHCGKLILLPRNTNGAGTNCLVGDYMSRPVLSFMNLEKFPWVVQLTNQRRFLTSFSTFQPQQSCKGICISLQSFVWIMATNQIAHMSMTVGFDQLRFLILEKNYVYSSPAWLLGTFATMASKKLCGSIRMKKSVLIFWFKKWGC